MTARAQSATGRQAVDRRSGIPYIIGVSCAGYFARMGCGCLGRYTSCTSCRSITPSAVRGCGSARVASRRSLSCSRTLHRTYRRPVARGRRTSYIIGVSLLRLERSPVYLPVMSSPAANARLGGVESRHRPCRGLRDTGHLVARGATTIA